MSQNPAVTEPGFDIKHRIVGALILIVLGVVAVPMILSGPQNGSNLSVNDVAAKNPDTKVFISKIIPIDETSPVLAGESKHSLKVAKIAPHTAKKTNSKAASTTTVKTAKAKPAAKAARQQAQPASEKNGSQRTKPENKRTATSGIITKPDNNSIQRGWIVRIGTFSKPENANRIMSSLKTLGFEPSAENVHTSRGVLTRVWVGPYVQRVEAGRVRSRIQQTTGEKGLIVAFP